jgi:hypothetical protein
MYIDNLYREGYLTPDDERLEIRFYVRAPLHSQQAKDQEKYIKSLEAKVISLQTTISKYEKVCTEKGIDINSKNKEEEGKNVIDINTKEELNEVQVKSSLRLDTDAMEEKKVNEGEVEDGKESLMKEEVFDAHSTRVRSPKLKENVFQEISNKCLSELKSEKQLMLNIKRKTERNSKPPKRTSLSATSTPNKKKEKQLNNSNNIGRSKDLGEIISSNN